MIIDIQSKVSITPAILASVFCSMNDEQQADFFIEIGKFVELNGGAAKWEMQWFYLGGHLRTCKCSTPLAREIVASIAAFTAREPS